MFRFSWLAASCLAVATLLTAGTERGAAQYVVAPTCAAPPVSYYTPAPVAAPAVSYYAPAPAVSYYAPAPAVSYYAAPAVSYYAPAPAVSYYATPSVSYYGSPAVYPGGAVTTNYRYGLFGLRRGSTTTYYPSAVGY